MDPGTRTPGKIAPSALMAILLVLPCCLMSATAAANPEVTSADKHTQRPKIGLVLSGGGARGFAHIGVLKKLEELNIPVDVVVGTSMGSIVAGLYAIGLSPDEIEDSVSNIEWSKVFNDYAEREYRSMRRKQDDYLFTPHRIGVSKDGFELAPGLIEGQQIELALDRLAYPGFRITDFDDFHIPYRAIATDLETGEAVVLGKGNLAKAMRASMSIPGMLPPVMHEGKVLVDGGIGNNIPIDVARELGADIVIVVDVSAPLSTQKELDTSIGVTAQLSTIMTRRIADQQLKTLRDTDVLIVPGKKDLSSASFSSYEELIEEGFKSADAMTDKLKALSLSREDYLQYKDHLPDVVERHPIIDFIEVKNQTKLDDEILSRLIRQKIGEPLDIEQLEYDLSIIYGLDLSSSVVYGLEQRDDQTGLIVYVRDREWAPKYLQLNFNLRTEFDVGAVGNIDLIYTNPTINRLSGEFRATGAVGSEPRLSMSVYQPLDKDLKYFAHGAVGFFTEVYPEVNASGLIDQLFRFQRNMIDIAVGRIFGQHTEFRLSVNRTVGRTVTLTGLDPAADTDFDEGSYAARILHDSMDNVDFPRSGYLGQLDWRVNRENLGSDLDYDQVRLTLGAAGTWGRYTVYGRTIIETTLDENAPENALFRRGGFLEVSGTIDRELKGQHYGLITAAFYRRLGDISLLPIYAGFSLETGNAWNTREEISLDNSIFAGSVFLGTDTFLGPVYLAYGINDNNGSSIYFYIGRRWAPQ